MNDICEVMLEHGITDANSKEAIALCLCCSEPKCLLGTDHKQVTSKDKVAEATRLMDLGLGTAKIAKTMHKSKRQVLRYLEVSNA